MKRVRILTVLLVMVTPAAVDAQNYEFPCPITVLGPPAMEGTSKFVALGQSRPCPPNGAREDFLVTTDFGDDTVAKTPFRPGDDLYLIGGEHAYRRAGRYDLVGTVTDRRTNQVT